MVFTICQADLTSPYEDDVEDLVRRPWLHGFELRQASYPYPDGSRGFRFWYRLDLSSPRPVFRVLVRIALRSPHLRGSQAYNRIRGLAQYEYSLTEKWQQGIKKIWDAEAAFRIVRPVGKAPSQIDFEIAPVLDESYLAASEKDELAEYFVVGKTVGPEKSPIEVLGHRLWSMDAYHTPWDLSVAVRDTVLEEGGQATSGQWHLKKKNAQGATVDDPYVVNFSSEAPQITGLEGLTGSFTPAHEFGHLLGLPDEINDPDFERRIVYGRGGIMIGFTNAVIEPQFGIDYIRKARYLRRFAALVSREVGSVEEGVDWVDYDVVLEGARDLPSFVGGVEGTCSTAWEGANGALVRLHYPPFDRQTLENVGSHIQAYSSLSIDEQYRRLFEDNPILVGDAVQYLDLESVPEGTDKCSQEFLQSGAILCSAAEVTFENELVYAVGPADVREGEVRIPRPGQQLDLPEGLGVRVWGEPIVVEERKALAFAEASKGEVYAKLGAKTTSERSGKKKKGEVLKKRKVGIRYKMG